MIKIGEIKTSILAGIYQHATIDSVDIGALNEKSSSYFILFTEKIEKKEIHQIIEQLPSRSIFFIGKKYKKELLFYGHFDLSSSYKKAETVEQFTAELAAIFYRGQNTGSLVLNESAIIGDQIKSYCRNGSYNLLLSFDQPNHWIVGVSWFKHYGNWMNGVNTFGFLRENKQYKVLLDHEIYGDVEIKIRVIFTDRDGEIAIQEFEQKQFILDVPEYETIQIEYLVKGTGEVEIRKGLFARNRGEFGVLLPGDEQIQTNQGETINCYEIPGKKHEKLIVSFTGALHHISKFEYTSLSRFSYPVLLFSDLRSRSGAFHIGKYLSKEYEDQLISRIEQALKKYGLDKSDVIFNGYSLGSFAAMYYGIKLNAKAVIVSKPIIQLGDVSKTNPILWAADGTMIDARYYLMERLDDADDYVLNNLLWAEFEKTPNLTTDFYLFNMSNDELDHGEYQRLRQLLTERKLLKKVQTEEGYHAEKFMEMRKFILNSLGEIGNE
ncbi:hypothetical protein D920_01885 [Enterococcus faecalis 13-SD-W-01]|nr:hypothetical protein D920_01885 [Enterococcus faecalis 13-SD-W-01]